MHHFRLAVSFSFSSSSSSFSTFPYSNDSIKKNLIVIKIYSPIVTIVTEDEGDDHCLAQIYDPKSQKASLL